MRKPLNGQLWRLKKQRASLLAWHGLGCSAYGVVVNQRRAFARSHMYICIILQSKVKRKRQLRAMATRVRANKREPSWGASDVASVSTMKPSAVASRVVPADARTQGSAWRALVSPARRAAKVTK